MKRLTCLLLALMLCLPALTFAQAEEPVSLTIAVMRRSTDTTESYSEKYFVKDSEAACNVKITWIELPEGQTKEPIAGMLAGNLPDIFMMAGNISDSVILQNAKLWQPITVEELQEYCPNVYNLYETRVEGWKDYLTFPDGNIYSLMGDFLTSTLHTVPQAQYINVKWLENLGLEMPKTLEDLHKVLVAFKEQDANGNGDPNDEIPMTFCDNYAKGKITNYASMWGLAIDAFSKTWYNIVDDQVVAAVNTPAFREFLEYFNELGKEGLLNLEGFSQTQDQFKADLDAMKVGVWWGWAPYNFITEVDNRMQYKALVPTPAEGYSALVYSSNPIRAKRGNFIITTACKNKEAALRWFNYISEPIHAIESYYGEKDVWWELVDDDYNWRPITLPDEELIAKGYGDYVGKTLNGANTLGYVNGQPLMLHTEWLDMNNVTGNTQTRQVAVDTFKEAGVIAPYMSKAIIPADAQEEFDFMTEGLDNLINGFISDSILKGVTDASWNEYVEKLEQYNYSYYLDFYNRYLHNELK